MDSTPLPSKTPLATEEENLAIVFSLYEALQGLPDARRTQGKRYSLAVSLCLLLLAKLAGQKNLSGATEWLRHRRVTLAQRFGLKRPCMPCQMTYYNVFATVDAIQLDSLLSAFFQRWETQTRCGEEPSRLLTPQGYADHCHLAIDGTALRATSSQKHPVHHLSCYEVTTGRVLWHCNVQEKHNEGSRTQAFFDDGDGQRTHSEPRCTADAT